MDIEKEYKEAKREIVRKILERGLFKGNDYKTAAVNILLSRLAQKDDDFVDMLLEFISGRVSEKQMTEKIESIIKEIKLHEQ